MSRYLLSIPLIVAATVVSLAQAPTTLADRIGYATTAPHDAVAALQRKLDAGEARLAYDPAHGYLPAVLDALRVPRSSQGLVFSRTSLQVDHIAPWSPRAVYFNDDVYVAWEPKAPMMEIASVDPTLGAVFYTIDQTAESDHPKFERQTKLCLVCHDTQVATGGVPGFMLFSIFSDRYGYTLSYPGLDHLPTTDQTPIAERWGGWYVTGTSGDRHRGNVVGPKLAHEYGNIEQYVKSLTFDATSHITDLHGRFDVSRYLTADSDIVALLLLAHQASVHDLITTVAYDAAIEGNTAPQTTQAIDRLAQALLFVGEAPIAGPVEGTSGFAAEFAARGPRDAQGRSLRDFDLKDRLFRYPVSYLIYSDGFEALPQAAKTAVYARIRAALVGADPKPEMARFPAEARAAALEILRSTTPDFASAAQQDQPF